MLQSSTKTVTAIGSKAACPNTGKRDDSEHRKLHSRGRNIAVSSHAQLAGACKARQGYSEHHR